jgi:predicted MPP superfamily phosphohydrolase
MSAAFSWLHLSDFHVGKDEYGQRQLFDQMLAHVGGRARNEAPPNIVILSGDIANRGKAEEYAAFSNHFLFPLNELLGGTPIYAVPGNHDVNRDEVRVLHFDGILSRSPNLLDPTAEGLNDRKVILPRFENFIANDLTRSSAEHWLRSPAGCFIDHVKFNNRRISVIGVNTAWLSHGDQDQHRLSPGKPIVENALKIAGEADLTIVIGHHPVDWFLDEEVEPIGAVLARESVVYLHGHLHRTRSKYEDFGPGRFLSLQAGAAFQARESEEWINRLLWAEVDFPQRAIRVAPYQWSRRNQEWVIDSACYHSRFREEGADRWVFPFPQPFTAPKPLLKTPPPPGRFKSVVPGWAKLEPAPLTELARAGDPARILAYFDGRSPSWAEALSPEVPRRMIVEQLKSRLVRDAENNQPSVIVLRGAGGEGKSTVIRQVAGDLCLQDSKWKIIWHEDSESPLKPDLIRLMYKEPGSRWLIVSDDAERIAEAVHETTNRLHQNERTDIHFLLSACDTDWRAANADKIGWRLHFPMVEFRLRGLVESDARLIVRAWSSFGSQGLGRLSGLNIEEGANKLLESAQREERLKDEGAFLGAMLRTRIGEDLKDHITALLNRLQHRRTATCTLADAFAYIAALHSENKLILTRDVLADTLGCNSGDLRRLFLGPLGEEAAVGSIGTCILTRHRAIAETAVDLLSQNIDFDEIFADLAKSAIKVFNEGSSVPFLEQYESLSSHFYKKGDNERAIRIGSSIVKKYPHKCHYVTHLAQLYRETGQLPSAIILFRRTPEKGERDRVFFHEWAAAEAASGNPASAAYLYWLALSDVAEYGPVKNDQARVGLYGMAAAFRALTEQHTEPRFANACTCGVLLCRRLKLDDAMNRRLNELQRILTLGEVSTDCSASMAMTTLATGALAAWEHLERRLPEWIQRPSQITVIGLSRLLGSIPPPKAQFMTSPSN